MRGVGSPFTSTVHIRRPRGNIVTTNRPPGLVPIAPLSASALMGPVPATSSVSPHRPRGFGQMGICQRGETTTWRAWELFLWRTTEPQRLL